MASGIFKYEPLWGEWYIDELIGRGSYGEVYKIHKDVEGVRLEAAVKYISIPKAEDKKSFRQYTQNELVTLFNERADKFSVEISSMLKLRDSKNVVRYEDHIKKQKENDIGWDIIIRMELLTSLEDYLDENNFSGKDVAKLGMDICSAIESCQANDIIHRDIKIENVFVDPFGNYKLGDFGVSKVGSGTATGTVTGTEDYMAPEISQEHKYNKTVDIYALGIAMYQLLNNRRKPFIDADSVPGQDAEAQAHIKRIKGEQMPLPKYANEELGKIVLKACAFNKNDRYSSPREMADDIKNIMDTLSDDAVMTARGRRDSYPTDERNESYGSETITDVPGKNQEGGGTIADIPIKQEEKGTVRDINPSAEPRKKKSKKKWYILGGVACALIVVSGISVLIFGGRTGTPVSGPVVIEEIVGLPDDDVKMVVGDTFELEPEIVPAEATGEFTFESTDEDIITVDEDGVVTAEKEGRAKVRVGVADKVISVTFKVESKKIPVSNIIMPTNAELTVGSSTTVTATIQPSDATVQQVKYTSSDSNIATVDNNGVINAISVGQVIIKASADGVEKDMILTVKAPVVNTKPATSKNTSNTKPKSSGNSNNYTPPANNTPAVNNTPAPSNAGANNQSGGGSSSGKEISSGVEFKYY